MLVMEYLPLGNLAQNNITEDHSVQILYQGLQALEYLHSQSPPLAHRDIKPENILIQSRIPFLIKIIDFGLANNGSVLQTFCGSNLYVAPEVWEQSHYTAAVDTWSLGVVVLECAYGLPQPTEKCGGSQWCRDIAKFAEDGEDGDSLIGLLSTRMLRMKFQDRLSASNCLRQAHRLGFHSVQTFDTGPPTPTGKSTRQQDITGPGFKSIVMQPLLSFPLDSNVRGTTESTDIAPSKRDLQEGFYHYNHTLQPSIQQGLGATQIFNPQSEDIFDSTPTKRRRQQIVQFLSNDAWGRGQSKRSRASVSFEACKDSFKPSNSQNLGQRAESFTQAVDFVPSVPCPIRQVAPKSCKKRTRSPLGRASAPGAEASQREVEPPSSKSNIHNNVRALLAESLDDENEGQAKVKVYHRQ